MGCGKDAEKTGKVKLEMNMIGAEIRGVMTYSDSVEGQDATVFEFLRHGLCTVDVSAPSSFSGWLGTYFSNGV